MTRLQLGKRLQVAGSLLIVTPMLTDRFLFSVQEPFLVACAIVAAVLLGSGILMARTAEARATPEKAG